MSNSDTLAPSESSKCLSRSRHPQHAPPLSTLPPRLPAQESIRRSDVLDSSGGKTAPCRGRDHGRARASRGLCRSETPPQSSVHPSSPPKQFEKIPEDIRDYLRLSGRTPAPVEA